MRWGSRWVLYSILFGECCGARVTAHSRGGFNAAYCNTSSRLFSVMLRMVRLTSWQQRVEAGWQACVEDPTHAKGVVLV